MSTENMQDPKAILKYIVTEKPQRNGEPDVLEQILLARRDDRGLEDILRESPATKEEITGEMADEEASEVFHDFLEEVVEQQRKVRVVYYVPSTTEEDDSGNLYIVEDEESEFDYMFVPRGISVNRVSQNVLGPNVLGRTWLGSGYIEVLDSLYGDAFQEVLLHELNHLLYPHENEAEIRDRTRRQVSYPIFH